MATNKIKSLSTLYLIKYFRNKLHVQQNLQFLIFGQWIPKGGFKHDSDSMADNITQYKSMRTQELADVRAEEKKRSDDSIQYIKSQNDLIQFDEIKRILLNLTFMHQYDKILCNDITWDVLDESRKERKIIMVLNDDGVDDYVNTDITELDIERAKDDLEMPLAIKIACEQKLKFRYKMAQNVSLFRMDYMLKVMKKVFGKYQIAHPKGFKAKLRQVIK